MKTDLRILAVEDETAVAQFLALVLCGPNCKVMTAHDGRDALAFFADCIAVKQTGTHSGPAAAALKIQRQHVRRFDRAG